MRKITLSKAKDRAWKTFSLYIRTRDCIKTTGTKTLLKCVTCGKLVDIKKAHASHFIPGRHLGILFDERGVNGSCYTCNVVLGSNGPKYYKWMLNHYGQKVIDDLERIDNTTVKYTVKDYLEIEKKYKEKLSHLQE